MQRGAESARHPRRTTPLRQTTRSPWRNDPHRYRVKWNESIGDDTNNLLYNRNIRLHWDLDDYIDGNVRKAFDWVTYLGSEIAAHGVSLANLIIQDMLIFCLAAKNYRQSGTRGLFHGCL